MSDAFKPLLARLADGATMDEADAEVFFGACLRGEPGSAQVAAALTALRMRGETVGEITACARAMRGMAVTLEHPYPVIDVCGTGGDGAHTFNVSTAVAFVVAGAGVRVAKHGNRAISSRSGAADVLTALGVDITADAERQRRALDEAGVCFLFAPAHHGAMRHVTPIRQELGFRTLFNLLGPLANPAGAPYQLLGVGEAELLDPLAGALAQLGTRRAFLVHGRDGLDEVSLSAPTLVREVRGHEVMTREWTPKDFGLEPSSLEDLRADGPAASAVRIRDLLAGKPGPAARVVMANAAAALLAAERVQTLAEGVGRAAESLSSGRAQQVLERLLEASHDG